MLIFAASDKGGTGRSVTSCNLAYRLSLLGKDVAYLDFDFGSPTSGAIFEIPRLERGTEGGGLHSYLMGLVSEPTRVDVRLTTERAALKERPPGAGRLILFPGDVGGSEFALGTRHVETATALFQSLQREFDICIIDLSAGRSAALDMSLHAASPKVNRMRPGPLRWLLFHRWTTQHVIAAAGLMFDKFGIVQCATDAGFAQEDFLSMVRTVRTAVPTAGAFGEATAEQARWLRSSDDYLKALAKSRHLGQDRLAGVVPLEPMLLWREQVIMDADVRRGLARPGTVEAFNALAGRVIDDNAWEGF